MSLVEDQPRAVRAGEELTDSLRATNLFPETYLQTVSVADASGTVPETLERDAYDAAAIHVIAIDEGNVVGTLRIVFLPEHAKFGRVAVLRQARGKGIATAMMRAAMRIARERGETRLYLTAQTDKIGLYEKLGFVAYGEEFEEGGMPHRAMKTY